MESLSLPALGEENRSDRTPAGPLFVGCVGWGRITNTRDGHQLGEVVNRLAVTGGKHTLGESPLVRGVKVESGAFSLLTGSELISNYLGTTKGIRDK